MTTPARVFVPHQTSRDRALICNANGPKLR